MDHSAVEALGRRRAQRPTLFRIIPQPPHVVSALLGHRSIEGSLHSGYKQSRYRAEVAVALQLVAASASSCVDRMTSIALARIGATIVFGSVVRRGRQRRSQARSRERYEIETPGHIQSKWSPRLLE
jgi:hypothetical protein